MLLDFCTAKKACYSRRHQLLAECLCERTVPSLQKLAVIGALEAGQVDLDAARTVLQNEGHASAVGSDGDPAALFAGVSVLVFDRSTLVLLVRPVVAQHVGHGHVLVRVHVDRHRTGAPRPHLSNQFGVADGRRANK